MLSVPHLDREFDYLVSAEQSDDAQPGVRVRVRFHGRLVDAFVLERRSNTDHAGQLGWLDRVISAEPGLTGEVRRLVDAVAARYAGTRPDIDDVVRCIDRVFVVFDHEYGIAEIAQMLERRNELIVVALM